MRYYGCKTKLLSSIEDAVKKTELNHGSKFVDLFSGTTAVAQHFKKKGYTVITNDFLEFSYALAKAYIELNSEPRFAGLKKIFGAKLDKQQIISYLNGLKSKKGFIYNHYCPEGRGKRKFFSAENAGKIDAIREELEDWKKNKYISELEYYYLLAALLEAVNLVSNVAGTYGAYLKKWDNRALKKIRLVAPEIIPSIRKNKAYKKDANELIKEITADILYLDPPYNSRQYASNYFMLELIAEGWFDKKPKIYGQVGMRPYESQLSAYSMSTKATNVFRDLIGRAKAKYIILSYNNEGIIPDADIYKILESKGNLSVFQQSHKRYKSINQKDDDPCVTNERIFLVETPQALKRANKLDGGTWLKHSFSLWKDIAKNSEEKKLEHPAMFPIQLAERCVEIYTNGSGKNVLDCFAGSGSTLIAGLKRGMNVYGVDISKEFKNLFENRINNEYKEFNNKKNWKYFLEDANDISSVINKDSIDLCITSPPYWDILNEKRTADQKIGRNYTNKSSDIGNIQSYENFLDSLYGIMKGVFSVMKTNGYCIMVVMDIRKGNKFYPFHSDVAKMMEKAGFRYEDLIIWDRQKEYNNCKPLGYPYKFIVNKIHEYILIFKKNGQD